jgi:hypothetical protein
LSSTKKKSFFSKKEWQECKKDPVWGLAPVGEREDIRKGEGG